MRKERKVFKHLFLWIINAYEYLYNMNKDWKRMNAFLKA